ncbi:Kiwa anti-phage protein KwaB-like domain-containing protein [Pontibacillus salipaludis]|uniref:DUF4868 domain-containing protein n=1 Tax=Pontibacillus salipaludis TaxID=1697394 RepID=A0ABQ1PS53_9BACI|nr:Kiwa anti-phage protein KwaB-like domain-containing protein [Pontibacillus salipaludis]GGD02276.1 hypothetical protein GCM10011389_07130 [Pontibacillus salipaludis]
MDLNSGENIIQKLSGLDVGEDNNLSGIGLSFHLVRKQKHADNLYQSKEVSVSPEVTSWLKKHIVKSLNELKKDDSGVVQRFHVGQYNHEINRQDQLMKFDLDNSSDLLARKRGLISELANSSEDFPEDQTNFQIVKLTYEGSSVYFCYYRGTKKSSSKKKWALKTSNEYTFVTNPVMDIGGNIDFFILENYIFIVNIKPFEYAFNYRDHIIRKRDQRLSEITGMDFFNGNDSNPLDFEEKCKAFIYSRSIAKIDRETIEVLESNFSDRCAELLRIRENAPDDTQELEEYKRKIGSLWTLFDYIDTENNKIIYNEDMSPTPLIHFFTDKIAKSFLTEDVKVVMAYE